LPRSVIHLIVRSYNEKKQNSKTWINPLRHGGTLYLELENWKSLPVEEKTISATSASQRIDNSSAFLNNPFLLLEKVTCLAAVLSILLSLSFSLAMATVHFLLSEEKKKLKEERGKEACKVEQQPREKEVGGELEASV
jgi:hypothetical protein